MKKATTFATKMGQFTLPTTKLFLRIYGKIREKMPHFKCLGKLFAEFKPN